MRTIQHIWFDFDNTLADRNGAMEKALHQWLVQNTSLTESELKEVMEKAMHFDNWGYTSRTEFSHWLIEVCKLNWQDEPILVARQILQNVAGIIQRYEATEHVLQHCQSRYSIGLLTNGPSEVQRKKIESSGIGQYFAPENILVSGEIGHDKPSAECYAILLDRCKTNPKKILYVGDDPTNDIVGGAKVGIKTCWISHGRKYPFEHPRPDYVITSIADLLPLTGGGLMR